MVNFRLSNPNADDCALQLMEYFKSIQGKKIISGQHCNKASCPDIEFIRRVTGKVPALLGLDLLSYSNFTETKNASWNCIDEVENNKNSIETAIKWGKCGGIVTLCWHWFSPMGGTDKSFYTKNTTFNLAQTLKEKGEAYNAMCADMDKIAVELKRLRKENIPVLWRPLHEGDGTWFWWGAYGDEAYIELYRLMYDRFTKMHQLHNLIWVWNAPSMARYPGDNYVDIGSVDSYADKRNTATLEDSYHLMNHISKEQIPMAIGEIGSPPNLDGIFEKGLNWLWFMLWNGFPAKKTYNTLTTLREIYNDNRVITLN